MFQIREMTIDDYDGVRAMWEATPGVSVRDADSKAAVTRYLLRNPALSFVALADDQMVATIMAGHDGRRGYLQHLVVLPAYRRRGIANALVEQTLAALEALGIHKSHLEVLCTNVEGAAFWARQGWQRRDDITRYSFIRNAGANC
ncbi:GCN5 family acetyltransferase [Robbsia andropogonis]|uniref:GCN5 family acetyltransferase n=1 Tax=Robbsia andropogonis TaxID=28092 RepID=A0A0F5JWE8_9BURK|nr:GNAT family N-acetyltransferase [Robbsia andropogonis]KKB62178.1 GCN5 family acetyltransferase [Robbsia andropogonis]MCP1119447.1 GNAT family N-acetyltransferase [Robbsia andropogonis]MCP1129430.1 GNAT family N-acetyltransferase [Robbsia andropogonis]